MAMPSDTRSPPNFSINVSNTPFSFHFFLPCALSLISMGHFLICFTHLPWIWISHLLKIYLLKFSHTNIYNKGASLFFYLFYVSAISYWCQPPEKLTTLTCATPPWNYDSFYYIFFMICISVSDLFVYFTNICILNPSTLFTPFVDEIHFLITY